jgi:hypothetical protein
VHVLKEDPKNTDLIYAGTELGLYATYDGGRNWIELGLKNLPRVSVHDIAVHPRENDLILATHGRSYWIFDDATPIQQMNADLANREATLFDLRPAIRFTTRFTRYGIGDKPFAGPNPPNGALITYYLKEKLDAKIPAQIQILDASGKVIRELREIPKEKGFNRVSWDMSHEGPKMRRPPTPEEEAQARSFGREMRGPAVLPGTYTVKLIINDKAQEKKVNVGMDPTVQVTAAELQTQLDYSMKLREMISATNTALRTLDGIKEQLQQIEKAVKERMPNAPKDLAGELTEHLKQTDEIIGKLASPQQREGLGYRGASQLSEKLSSLLSSVQGVNAAPTAAQKEFFDELQQEFQSEMPEVNKFLNEKMQKLNETLKKNNASTVIVGRAL